MARNGSIAVSPAERVKRILDETVGSDLSSWEKNEFLPSIAKRTTLTDKQERVLRELEARWIGADHG